MNMDYFNAEKTRDNLVNWIKDWFDRNGKDKYAVIGISGGKDSTIVAALCARALGTDRVLGVLMPNGTQADIQDSYRVCEKLGIASIVVNIQDAYAGVYNSVLKSLKYPALSEQTTINIAPRLRMTTLYAVSQTIGGRVVNTSNLSEFLTGYFTKNGDSCGDLKPLLRLTKNEVVAVGLTMPEIPRYLVEKTPADGLSEKTDEDKIGFSYDDLDTVIRGNFKGCPSRILKNLCELPEETFKKIQDRMNAVEFKTKPEEIFQDIELN